MQNYIHTYCNDFTVSPEIAYITGVVTNTAWLEEQYRERRDIKEEGENMCLAFEEWERKARKEGETTGIAKGKTEGISEERSRNVLSMHSNGVSAEEISHLCNIPYEEVKKIISSGRA